MRVTWRGSTVAAKSSVAKDCESCQTMLSGWKVRPCLVSKLLRSRQKHAFRTSGSLSNGYEMQCCHPFATHKQLLRPLWQADCSCDESANFLGSSHTKSNVLPCSIGERNLRRHVAEVHHVISFSWKTRSKTNVWGIQTAWTKSFVQDAANEHGELDAIFMLLQICQYSSLAAVEGIDWPKQWPPFKFSGSKPAHTNTNCGINNVDLNSPGDGWYYDVDTSKGKIERHSIIVIDDYNLPPSLCKSRFRLTSISKPI